MIDITPYINIITSNALWIGIAVAAGFLGYKLYEYWKLHKKEILEKVSNIQNKYKLPRQP